MHLFTSNSSEHSPKKLKKVTFILSFIATISLITIAEYTLRSQDFYPSHQFSLTDWARLRLSANSNSEKNIVFVGASRILLGIDSDYFSQQYKGYKIINLAVNGRSGSGTLLNLIKDKNFKGTIIFSTTPFSLRKESLSRQDKWINAYKKLKDHNTYKEDEIEFKLTSFKHDLAIFHPLLNFKLLAANKLIYNKDFNRPYIFVRRDRFLDARISSLPQDTLDKMRRKTLNNFKSSIENTSQISSEQWEKQIIEIYSDPIKEFIKRGGNLIFIKMPSDREHLNLEFETYPRKLFWDKLSSILKGVHTIHFQDLVGINKIKTYDGVHLDNTQKKIFTPYFVTYLKKILK